MGRVGRVGQSWVGNIYLESNLVFELLGYYKNDIVKNVELTNIENNVINICGDQNKIFNKDINKIAIVYNKNSAQA